MESNITEQEYFDGDLKLSEPHFEEEATVLSARPVVPLKQIKARARSGRRLVLGSSVAVALMVGALGATFVYKRQGQKSATAIVDAAIRGSGASAQNPAGSAPAETVAEPKVNEAEAPIPHAPVAEKKPAPPLAQKVAPARVEIKPKKSIARAEEQDQSDEQEMRRADRIDEWRLRRREERESRKESRGKNRPADDLLRIREIFEGRRRP